MLPLLPILLSIAPDLVRLFTGPKGELITEKAIEVVKAVTGTDDPAIAAEVLKDQGKVTELRVQLSKIESDERMADHENELNQFRSALFDIASARSQTVELAKNGSAIAWAPPFLSGVIILGFFVAPSINRYLDPSTNQIWLGALITAFTSVVGYWLGASASGRRAQEQVAQVTQQTADTINANIATTTKAVAAANAANAANNNSQKPQVVVVPPVAPVVTVPPVAPLAVPVPLPPASWKQGPYGGVRWEVLPEGVLVEGEAKVARSVGEPITVRKLWDNYGALIAKTCAKYSVPVEIAVALICTESKGETNAVLVEPDGRASGGLFQVLNTTAAAILKRDKVTVDDLKNPELNIEAGVMYIIAQKPKTWFDPILTAAAHNAGGLYPLRPGKDNNRFNLRSTGDHLERMIRWYGDACFVAKTDNWFGK